MKKAGLIFIGVLILAVLLLLFLPPLFLSERATVQLKEEGVNSGTPKQINGLVIKQDAGKPSLSKTKTMRLA